MHFMHSEQCYFLMILPHCYVYLVGPGDLYNPYAAAMQAGSGVYTRTNRSRHWSYAFNNLPFGGLQEPLQVSILQSLHLQRAYSLAHLRTDEGPELPDRLRTATNCHR